MKFVNLTPHEIVVDVEGERIYFPSAGDCRVKVTQTLNHKVSLDFKGTVLEIPVFRNVYGAVEGLPVTQPGAMYI